MSSLVAQQYPVIDYSLSNPNFNSYKLGSLTTEPSYFSFENELNPIAADAGARYQVVASKARFNHLTILKHSATTTAAYVLETRGIHACIFETLNNTSVSSGISSHAPQWLLKFVSEDAPALSMRQVETCSESMSDEKCNGQHTSRGLLALTSGLNRLRIIDTFDEHRVLFDQVLPLKDEIQNPFLLESALRVGDFIHLLLSSYYTATSVTDSTLVATNESPSESISSASVASLASTPVRHALCIVTLRWVHTSGPLIFERVSELITGAELWSSCHLLRSLQVDASSISLVIMSPIPYSRLHHAIEQDTSNLRTQCHLDTNMVVVSHSNSTMVSMGDSSHPTDVKDDSTMAHYTTDRLLEDDDPATLAASKCPLLNDDVLNDDDQDITLDSVSSPKTYITKFTSVASSALYGSLLTMDCLSIDHLTGLGGARQLDSITQQWQPILGMKSDVDLCLFSVNDVSDSTHHSLLLQHQCSFSALAYVALGKRHRKFFSFSPDLQHAVIAEHALYVYLYRHTLGVSAVQQLIQVPSDDGLIVGTQITNTGLFVATLKEVRYHRFINNATFR